MAEGADGFLGRWARRKNDALQGKPLDEPQPASTLPAGLKPDSGKALPAQTTAKPESETAQTSAPEAQPVEPVRQLSLDDVKDLTKDSDYKPFMSRGVEPGVRNAAMKKLFSDPHFNVMDRLDIYIDDYSQPDPLPLSMLRQMASAKFLNLFDDDEEEAKKAKDAADAAALAEPARETAHTLPDDSVAQSEPALDEPSLAALPKTVTDTDTQDSQEDHAHIDLRLQPDHAPESPDTGRGAA
jgi:hypothetical protein